MDTNERELIPRRQSNRRCTQMDADNFVGSSDSRGACLACEADFESVEDQVASPGTKATLPRHPNLRSSAVELLSSSLFVFIRGPYSRLVWIVGCHDDFDVCLRERLAEVRRRFGVGHQDVYGVEGSDLGKCVETEL